MSRLHGAAILAIVLSAGYDASTHADSAQATLRVGVQVTRRCAVTSGATLEVTCTRTRDASAVQATVDGRALAPSPLRVSGPGTTAASIPLEPQAAGRRVVTILF